MNTEEYPNPTGSRGISGKPVISRVITNQNPLYPGLINREGFFIELFKQNPGDHTFRSSFYREVRYIRDSLCWASTAVILNYLCF